MAHCTRSITKTILQNSSPGPGVTCTPSNRKAPHSLVSRPHFMVLHLTRAHLLLSYLHLLISCQNSSATLWPQPKHLGLCRNTSSHRTISASSTNRHPRITNKVNNKRLHNRQYSKMAQTQPAAPSNPPLSPLLALPLELKLEIISYLIPSDTPDLALLRRTYSSFHAAIPKSQLRSKPTALELRDQLFNAQFFYSYLLPNQHLPCRECSILFPRDTFDERWKVVVMSHYGGNDDGYVGFCFNCWIRRPDLWR